MTLSNDFVRDSSRQHLYFNQYKYRCCMMIGGMNYFKNTTTREDVDFEVVRLQQEPFHTWRKPLRSASVENIKMFVSWRNRVKDKQSTFKLVITQNTVNIYSNEPDLILSIKDHFSDTDVVETIKLTFSEIREDYEHDVIYRANPQYKYRVYFKSRRVTQEEKNELHEFLLENQVTMSASLERWFERERHLRSMSGGYWVWDYLFFDYDDEYIVTLLALKFDNTIRKICRIVKK